MANKPWAYTNLAVKDAVFLEVNGVRFKVAQLVISFAKNSIPTAQCLLAIGRKASVEGNLAPGEVIGFAQNPADEAALVHSRFSELKRMQDAAIVFRPDGEYAPDGRIWPSDFQVIFRGVIAGVNYRKVQGKVHAVVSLSHWLIKLAFGSMLWRNGHVMNPSQLNIAATLLSGNASVAQGSNLGVIASRALVGSDVANDLWFAVKRAFLRLTEFHVGETQSIFAGTCSLNETGSANERARFALDRIEPFGVSFATDTVPPFAAGPPAQGYHYGRPLRLYNGAPQRVIDSVRSAIANESLHGLSGTTFWDKLIGGICPTFNMAVVPMVESALVIADVPALRAHWKTVIPDEYDSFDMGFTLDLPLRAVGVFSGFESRTNAAQPGAGQSNLTVPILGGCFVAEDDNEPVPPNTGMIAFVPVPRWLEARSPTGSDALGSSGLGGSLPSGSATTPVALPPGSATGDGTLIAYQRYARAVYLMNTLRGRNGVLSGKLRFDIAPGSNIRIETSGERFIDDDALAVPQFAHVVKVTITINAEASQASTAFQLTHVRSEQENSPTAQRTSAEQHPLFDQAAHGNGKHGSPLLPVYDL